MSVARTLCGALAVGVLAVSLMGCQNSEPRVVRSAAIDNLPACLTSPQEVDGGTYYALDAADAAQASRTHPDPRTPPSESDPQPSAAWEDYDDGRGTLYVYDDGFALFIAVTGKAVWFSQDERTWDAVC